jgi:hypothetical protein
MHVILLARLFLMVCVSAGLGTGMIHGALHKVHDECVSHSDSDHGHHHGEHHDHDHDPGTEPHDHACCQLPSADRPKASFFLPSVFVAVLVEIAADRSLVPDEPVYALDKPPLI